MDCLFCKIMNKEIDSKIIYEDNSVVAFLDAFPDSVGHTLIVPKEHFECLDDIPNDILYHIMDVSKLLKKRIEERLNCNGLTLIQNNGNIQEIKHYHLHLKPFYENKKELSLEEVFNLLK